MKSILIGFILFIPVLCLEPFWGEGSFAAMSVTIPSSSSTGQFTIQGNNFAGVAAIDIKLSYDSATMTNPRVQKGTLIQNGLVPADVVNTLEQGQIQLIDLTIPPAAFNGTGSLFIISFDLTSQLPGEISSIQTKLLNDNIDNQATLYSNLKIYDNAITITDKISGSTSSTNSKDVSLAITDKLIDIVNMQVSEDSFFANASWEPYATSRAFTLSDGNGTKTVYIRFKDDAGYEYNNVYKASILYDNIAPTGTIKLNSGALSTIKTAVTANLAFTDVGGSGIDKIQFSFDGNTWGELQSYAATKSLTLPNGDGLKTVYVKVFDKAGNSFEKSASITLDTTPPSAGTVLIKGTEPTDSYTNKASVILKIGAANDASPVTAYCVSNSVSCTTWTAISATTVYPISRSWTLAAGANGERTVYVRFRDKNGISSTPVSDTINLDTALPVNGVLAITQLPKDELIPSPNNKLKLDWSDTSDALSGVKEYRLYHGATAIPACSGTPLYSGNLMTYTHTGLAEGSTHYYRLCTYDTAGNRSLGATKSAKAIPELSPPTGGGIMIKGTELTDTYTNKTTVTLSISAATDASPVTAYCVSNSATCPAWTAISATAIYPIKRSWILASGVDSTRTVNLWYRDKWGNVSEMFSDTINLDRTLPVNGVLAITQLPKDELIPSPNNKLKLDWSDTSDALSGVKEYRLYHGATAIPACSGTPLYSGNLMTYTHTGLAEGSTHYYRLCTYDTAGNRSLGATKSAKAIPELGPPTGGGIMIKGTELTDTYTNKTTVTLSISAATDASPVTAYCVSNSATCPAWTAISATALYPIKRSWILASGVDSTRTVNLWYRDKWGNVSEMFSDTINLDRTPPVNGTLTVTPQSRKNSLTWSDFNDAFSGVAGYRLMRGITAPTTCATGIPIAKLTLTTGNGSYEDTTGLKAGTLYYYRLCAVDNAGNISTGVVKSGKPSP